MKRIAVVSLAVVLMLIPIMGLSCDSDGSEGNVNQDGENLSWTAMSSGTEKDLFDVWGSSPDDVFVVGWNMGDGDNNILHYDGNNWSEMDMTAVPFPHQDLWGVWGSSSTDVFAVGKNGTILHYGEE